MFDWAWSKLSQATVTIGSLNSQDMITFMITTGFLSLCPLFFIKFLCILPNDSPSESMKNVFYFI